MIDLSGFPFSYGVGQVEVHQVRLGKLVNLSNNVASCSIARERAQALKDPQIELGNVNRCNAKHMFGSHGFFLLADSFINSGDFSLPMQASTAKRYARKKFSSLL